MARLQSLRARWSLGCRAHDIRRAARAGLVATVALVATAALAACSGSDQPVAPPAPPAQPPVAEVQPPPVVEPPLTEQVLPAEPPPAETQSEPPAETQPPAETEPNSEVPRDEGRRDFYVSPAGSDAGPGTIERPWRTLERALTALRAGRRVVVRAGTYMERLELGRGGTRAAPAQLVAYPGERPVLVGRLKVIADHVRVVGLVIDGTGGSAYDSALYIAGAQGVEIRGCEVRNAVGSGVFVGDEGDPTSDLSLLGNWIHDNGQDDFHDHGIYWQTGVGGVIGNNVIEQNAGFGIHFYPDGDDVLITHNTVVGSGRSGIILGGVGSSTSDGDLIVNNIVALNGEFGIRSSWDGPPGTGNVVRNNLLFGNALGDFPAREYTAGLAIKPDNRTADPRFVDRNSGNYRLSPSSPARDTALKAHSLARDFDGRARPRGAAPDVGAFEG